MAQPPAIVEEMRAEDLDAVRHRVRLKRPHVGQADLERTLSDRSNKVVVAACGRRWGKTTGVVEMKVRRTIKVPGIRLGWFSPTYKSVRVAWEHFLRTVPKSYIEKKSEVEFDVTLINGSRWQFWSLEKPDNVLGWGYDDAVLDEGARVSLYARDEIVAPMVADRDGQILVITTPKGQKGRGGHVWRDVKKAQSKEPGFAYRSGPTHENPLPGIQKWLTFAERNLSDRTWRQEILAKFLEEGAAVLNFEGIATLGGDAQHPVPLPYFRPWSGLPTIGGLDLADAQNYTVLSIFERPPTGKRNLVALDRFQRIGWENQIDRVIKTLRRYSRTRAEAEATGKPARTLVLYADATGVGDAVVEFIIKAIGAAGVSVQVIPIKFSNDSKMEIVQSLVIASEQKEIAIPWIEEALSEADTLEEVALKSGRIRYQAAEGFHDDIAMSLGLATFGMNRTITGRVL